MDGDEIEIALDEPVSAITPGQSIVLYDGERVLGGGFIEAASDSRRAAPANTGRLTSRAEDVLAE